MAKWLGFDCNIYVPSDMVLERQEAIESEGAKVIIVEGSYDDAVKMSAKEEHVISDTSWEGYEKVPRDIVDGYSTIFWEIEEQVEEKIDFVFVPTGLQLNEKILFLKRFVRSWSSLLCRSRTLSKQCCCECGTESGELCSKIN